MKSANNINSQKLTSATLGDQGIPQPGHLRSVVCPLGDNTAFGFHLLQPLSHPQLPHVLHISVYDIEKL